MTHSLKLADLHLTLVMPQPLASRGRQLHGHSFSLGHAKSDKSGTFNLGKPAWTDLGKPAYIQIYITPGGVFAIKPCKPADEGARRLDSTRRVRAHELTSAFGIQPGERFIIEGVLDDGHLLGEASEELLARMAERQRREGGHA